MLQFFRSRRLINKSLVAFAGCALALSACIATWKLVKAEPNGGPTTGIPVHFTDIRAAAGITFRHDNTFSADKNYLETMGNGLGWIDYDQDGLMDLYFVQIDRDASGTSPPPLAFSSLSQQW